MTMKDLRPWFVNDPHWTPGYVSPAHEAAPAHMTLHGFERLLDSAAFAGDSAYIGLCFDVVHKD